MAHGACRLSGLAIIVMKETGALYSQAWQRPIGRVSRSCAGKADQGSISPIKLRDGRRIRLGRMLTILYVSAAGERGGVEVALLNTLKCLDRSRFNPVVVLLEDGPFSREIRESGTTVHVVTAGRVRNLWQGFKAVAEIHRIMQRERASVVHTHNAKAHLYGGLAAARVGVPCVYHLHGVPRASLSRDGVVSLLSVLMPSLIAVACSAYVEADFRRMWRSKRHLVVVHNGVEPKPQIKPGAADLVRAEFGVPVDAPLILMVSRLQRWKGIHIFLDAAAHVARKHPDACFLVVGGTLFGLEEDYPLQLQQQVEHLRLGHAVRFTGFQSDVFPFYSASDIVVHSSIEPEPFGMVLLEAMACERPVVASDSGGPREIVRNGVTGLLVPPEDAERLAHAILSLLDDPDRRVRMGQAGAERVRHCFSAERMARELEAIYEQVAKVEKSP